MHFPNFKHVWILWAIYPQFVSSLMLLLLFFVLTKEQGQSLFFLCHCIADCWVLAQEWIYPQMQPDSFLFLLFAIANTGFIRRLSLGNFVLIVSSFHHNITKIIVCTVRNICLLLNALPHIDLNRLYLVQISAKVASMCATRQRLRPEGVRIGWE